MKEQQTVRFMAAVPQCAKVRFEEILSAIGLEPDAICLSGGEAIEKAQGEHVLLLTTYQLSDMTGGELAGQLGEDADVLMIVPGDYEPTGEENGALLLYNPISREELYQAIRATMHAQKKILALKARAQKSERQLAERKIIDRAKGRLMDELHLSEKQAHYYIQKKSMDEGRRIVDVAREIIEKETVESEA